MLQKKNMELDSFQKSIVDTSIADTGCVRSERVREVVREVVSDIETCVQKPLEFPTIKDEDHLQRELSKIFAEDVVESFDADPTISNFVVKLAQREFIGKKSLKKAITDLCKEFKGQLKSRPSIPVLVQHYEHLLKENIIQPNDKMRSMMKLKSVRSESGVLVVTVLTSPGKFSCPKNCHYCPNEVNENGNPIMPRSYISTEPACRRATECLFDGVIQFFSRARRLQINGHKIDKIEYMVLGGTFTYYPREYQHEFVRDLFYAANVYHEYEKTRTLRERYSLEEEQIINETAVCRVIGLTIETRPDHITMSEIKNLRILGVTRVQLGIQHVDDEILDYINRECPTKKTIIAIKRLKDNGFKVDGHFMPDLPGSTPEKDIKMFYHILTSPDFQIDYWKIYPCEVTPFTEIEKWYKSGAYKPYAELENGKYLINVIIYVLCIIHRYIRVNRVIRDIPNQSEKCPVGIIGGNMVTNLRQIIDDIMKKMGLKCVDIRNREVKDGESKDEFSWDTSSIFVEQYESSGGNEYFISVEHQTGSDLYGLLRLRFNNPDDSVLANLKDCALIRELHVYGNTVPVKREGVDELQQLQQQHRGIGKTLMQAAEQIARKNGWRKLAVIAGVGTREYYRKLGYRILKPYNYMIKDISVEKDVEDLVFVHITPNIIPKPNIQDILAGKFETSIRLQREINQPDVGDVNEDVNGNVNEDVNEELQQKLICNTERKEKQIVKKIKTKWGNLQSENNPSYRTLFIYILVLLFVKYIMWWFF